MQSGLAPCFVGGEQDEFEESQAVEKQAQSLHQGHIKGMLLAEDFCAVSGSMAKNIAFAMGRFATSHGQNT